MKREVRERATTESAQTAPSERARRNRSLSICTRLILDSSVDDGTPRRTAAPHGPDTRPSACSRARWITACSLPRSVASRPDGVRTTADSSHRCAGECTRFVSEELGGNERFRDRREIDGGQGTRGAPRSTQSSTCRSAGDRVTTPSSSHRSFVLLDELNRSVAEVVMSAPPSRREPPTDGQ